MVAGLFCGWGFGTGSRVFGAELLGEELLPGGQEFWAGTGSLEAVEDGAAGARKSGEKQEG